MRLTLIMIRRTHIELTSKSNRICKELTSDPYRTHFGFTSVSHRIHIGLSSVAQNRRACRCAGPSAQRCAGSAGQRCAGSAGQRCAGPGTSKYMFLFKTEGRSCAPVNIRCEGEGEEGEAEHYFGSASPSVRNRTVLTPSRCFASPRPPARTHDTKRNDFPFGCSHTKLRPMICQTQSAKI